jgi:hypothetical protein
MTAMAVTFRRILSQAVARLRSKPYPPLAVLVKSFDSNAPPDVLYVGDSVVERVSRDDTDQRTLAEMVGDRLRGQKTLVGVSHSAFHPRMHHALFACLLRLRSRPETVILPINVRAFSPQWDLDPAFQFKAELDVLQRFAAGQLRVVPSVAPTTPSAAEYEEFDRIPLTYANCPLTTVGQFRRVIHDKPHTAEAQASRDMQIFNFFYMTPFTREHRCFVALTNAVRLLKKAGIRVVSYVTPLNFQSAEAAVGASFETVISEKVGILSELGKETDHFVDWSRALDQTNFFHRKFHTEHLNQRGRAWLSESVARLVTS